MTIEEKINKVRLLLPSSSDITDEAIEGYLDLARLEILNSVYGERFDPFAEVPDRYSVVQCMAVVVGLGLVGGTNESSHSENGVSRNFVYSDMVDYIRSHTIPIVEVR